MKRSLPDNVRISSRRPGVTLVEMLVTLAVLLLIMTVIVQIFQAATGSLSSAQAYQELDNQLRRLDSTIRADLGGLTAHTTPPLDPANNLGYIEYGENEFADMQGEDSDDYIRFTAKAPPDRPFIGRMYAPPLNNNPNLFNANFQPITITSEYAEIIYFLRNGNLYRRVLLVAPDRQSTIVPTINNQATIVGAPNNPYAYQPVSLGSLTVSWQGVNDLSAHPAPSGQPFHFNSVILNTLGDLTNRENRFAAPRFANDYQDLSGAPVHGGDGLADDFNGGLGQGGDNVPDYYNSLYPGAFNYAAGAVGQLIFEPQYGLFARSALGMLAFPYVFPAAYSRPQALATDAYGWIHSPNPEVSIAGAGVRYDLQPLAYLQNINHNPLDSGDNLPLPPTAAGFEQTWWGFPTWRESLSPQWNDPTRQPNGVDVPPFNFGFGPSRGLNPLTPGPGGEVQTGVVDNTGTIRILLPAMTSVWRNTPQPYTDGFGGNNTFFPGSPTVPPPPLWSPYGWEDDLIMTNVRSFDIKIYDNALSGYADLGWGDDPRLTAQLAPPFLGFATALGVGQQIPYLKGNLDVVSGNYQLPAYASINYGLYDVINQTFAHEGRMPPLRNDNRLDASYPNPIYSNWNVGNFSPQYTAFPFYSSNVGDDSGLVNNSGVVRLRRVWDSWSTDYSKAPAIGVYPPGSTNPGFPAGPPYSPPIYPSYPPPYPAPLRGLQIQIRVVDPSNQRIKTLTIRQDFTDKL